MQEYMGEEGAESLRLDSSEAMEFHYFKLHDYDGNNKLDGLELGAAMTHFHESGPNGKHQVWFEVHWLRVTVSAHTHSLCVAKTSVITTSSR